MMQCPDCGGAGYTYYDEDGDKITEAIYNQLPAKQRERIICDRCEGTGEIEDDYEPDYERDYDE